MDDQDQQLIELETALLNQVAGWRLPPSMTRDELVSDCVSALWEATRSGRILANPQAWLLGTAQNKIREERRASHRRKQPTERELEMLSAPACANLGSGRGTPEIFRSEVWRALTDQKRRLIEEHVMYGRPLTEVARELGVNRSTAKSWVKRMPTWFAKKQGLQGVRYGGR